MKYVVLVIAVAVLFYVVMEVLSGSAPLRAVSQPFSSLPELPECADAITLKTLKYAVENSPNSKIFSIKLLETKDPVELAWSLKQQMRTCRVAAFTNGGEQPLVFTIRWLDRSAGKWYLQTVASDQSNQSPTSPSRAPSWRVVSIESRITSSDDVQTKYAWKLTVRNDSGEPAVFSGPIEFQDADGFIVDSDYALDLQVAPASDGVFTGYALMKTEDARKVARTVANISKH